MKRCSNGSRPRIVVDISRKGRIFRSRGAPPRDPLLDPAPGAAACIGGVLQRPGRLGGQQGAQHRAISHPLLSHNGTSEQQACSVHQVYRRATAASHDVGTMAR